VCTNEHIVFMFGYLHFNVFVCVYVCVCVVCAHVSMCIRSFQLAEFVHIHICVTLLHGFKLH